MTRKAPADEVDRGYITSYMRILIAMKEMP